MTTTIKLRSPRELGPALRKLGKSMDRAAVDALRKTARWGATEALRVSASSTPRPRARGTFERSFVVTKLPDGAALSNSARHAIFVELGRRAGKQPPLQAILDWLIAKRFRPTKGAGDRDTQLRSLARRIARKIGRKGTKGRYVMRRTMPGLQRRLRVEMAIAMSKAFERAAGR